MACIRTRPTQRRSGLDARADQRPPERPAPPEEQLCIGDTGGAYSASPVAADGRLYVTSEDGEIFVVKAGPEYELLATSSMDEVCLATPAISEGQILIRTTGHLFALEPGVSSHLR